MKWGEAKAEAAEIMENLRARFEPAEVRLVLRALNRKYHMEKQTPIVTVTESPYLVTASGSFGGGYQKPSTKESLVANAAAALVYELYPRREVQFIGPEWVREELRKQGFEKL